MSTTHVAAARPPSGSIVPLTAGTHSNNNLDFSCVGGLASHIRTLRELIIFPLMYKEVYARFNIKPPRGVLFHGPPGTGKTLIAQALANECFKGSHCRVTFYSRKGSDILDKWVGESEKRLRNLFEKAYACRPSIIFFDEIDALAPVRCSRQDQVHASVVGTLLVLMDGLDTMPGVVVIGATNRINAIDPALRRTGRFDRELFFPLPCSRARCEILKVHVRTWLHPPSVEFLQQLAEITSGYCGSDLQSLCAAAVMFCLKRTYPDIVSMNKIPINARRLRVQQCDFMNARIGIVPASRKYRAIHYRLNKTIRPLLAGQFDDIMSLLQGIWPHFLHPDFKYKLGTARYAGRFMIVGSADQGHYIHLAPAMLHHMEHLPTHILDIQSLYEAGHSDVEEACITKFREVRQCGPGILFTPRIDLWWNVIEQSTRAVFFSLLHELDSDLPILLLVTCGLTVPPALAEYFMSRSSVVVKMKNPTSAEREQFLAPLFLDKALYFNGDVPSNDHESNGDESIASTVDTKRFSRRLKGLDASPIVPLEFVHKVFMDISRKSRKRKMQLATSSSRKRQRKDYHSPAGSETVVSSTPVDYYSCPDPNMSAASNKSWHEAQNNAIKSAINSRIGTNSGDPSILTCGTSLDSKTDSGTSLAPSTEVHSELITTLAANSSKMNLAPKSFVSSASEVHQSSGIKSEVPREGSQLSESEGIVGASDDDRQLDMKLYRPQLVALLQRAVSETTATASCGVLERLYELLDRCVTSYASTLNRQPMLEQIKHILDLHEDQARLELKRPYSHSVFESWFNL